MYGQKRTIKVKKDFTIQGIWECYPSIMDTVDPESVQIWYQFDKSNVNVLMIPGIGMPPEKIAFGSGSKYLLKSDTLILIRTGIIEKMRITVYNRNFFSFLPDPNIESESVYLKRSKTK